MSTPQRLAVLAIAVLVAVLLVCAFDAHALLRALHRAL
jgi:hypothetical protein